MPAPTRKAPAAIIIGWRGSGSRRRIRFQAGSASSLARSAVIRSSAGRSEVIRSSAVISPVSDRVRRPSVPERAERADRCLGLGHRLAPLGLELVPATKPVDVAALRDVERQQQEQAGCGAQGRKAAGVAKDLRHHLTPTH